MGKKETDSCSFCAGSPIFTDKHWNPVPGIQNPTWIPSLYGASVLVHGQGRGDEQKLQSTPDNSNLQGK